MNSPSPADVRPTGLSRPDHDTLEITWSDGVVKRYALTDLQESCPCATCQDKRGQETESSKPADQSGLSASDPFGLPMLSPAEAKPLRLVSMKPVGNYAYSLQFNHGCGHGIYRFELLRQLGDRVED